MFTCLHLVERPTEKQRRNADAGSSPRCGMGFFSLSQLSVQTLLRCPYSPPCNNICEHVKNPKHWQPYHCLDTKMLHTLIGEGIALLLRLLCLKMTQVRPPAFPARDNGVLKKTKSNFQLKNNNLKQELPQKFAGFVSSE